jgi:ferredoxin-fold anticodon binding domain-containing protein
MKIRLVSIVLLLALAAGGVSAHGNKVHVFGIVQKVNPDSVVVKTKEGKTVEVRLAASTVYVERNNNQDKPAKLSDLAAGDLVVIHATPKDNGLEAGQVRFSVPAASKAEAPAAPKPKS